MLAQNGYGKLPQFLDTLIGIIAMVDAYRYGSRVGSNLHGAVGRTARGPSLVPGTYHIHAIGQFSECVIVHIYPFLFFPIILRMPEDMPENRIYSIKNLPYKRKWAAGILTFLFHHKKLLTRSATISAH